MSKSPVAARDGGKDFPLMYFLLLPLIRFNVFFLFSLTMIIIVANHAYALDPQFGSCDNEWCYWQKILSKKFISKAEDATLYEVNYVKGICNHSSITERMYFHTVGISEMNLSTHINWSKTVDTASVLCSDKLPVFMGDYTSVLNLNQPRLQTDNRQLNYIAVYAPVCYSVSIQEFYSDEFQKTHKFPSPLLKNVMISDPRQLIEYLQVVSSKPGYVSSKKK